MSRAAHVAEAAEGLEDLAEAELRGLGARVLSRRAGEVWFEHDDVGKVLARSRLVASVYRRLEFDVPRPKALLGDAAFRRLAAAVGDVASRAQMRSFRLAAAGADSTVFRRLAQELASATKLVEDQQDGELLLRVRRSQEVGWESLLRLTPRPLSARPWRVCNLAGGANATVAAAMADLGGAGGSYLNLMCGSGTLLVERALAGRTGRGGAGDALTREPGGRDGPLVGVDVSETAIDCAAQNLEAAGVRSHRLVVGDVTVPGFSVPLEDGGDEPGRFDVVAADAPWGDAVGSHAANEALYAGLLDVAWRHLGAGGRFVLLTHEVRLTMRLLSSSASWRTLEERRVAHGGHRPLLLVLERLG